MKTKVLSILTAVCAALALHAEFRAGFARVDATQVKQLKHLKEAAVNKTECPK